MQAGIGKGYACRDNCSDVSCKKTRLKLFSLGFCQTLKKGVYSCHKACQFYQCYLVAKIDNWWHIYKKLKKKEFNFNKNMKQCESHKVTFYEKQLLGRNKKDVSLEIYWVQVERK